MANHPSALKRIRQNQVRRMHNRYYLKTMRNAVRKFRALNDKKEAEEKLPKLVSMIDKVAKRGMIHKNKAANLKSSISKHVASIS